MGGPAKPKLLDPAAVIQAGTLPERVVPVCLALDLVAEYEDLENQLREEAINNRDSLSGGRSVEIREQMRALQERMEAATVQFRLKALPRSAFKALARKHPPRIDGVDALQLQRDMQLKVNEDTFFLPLLKACTVEPKLDDETWQMLVEERLTDAQYETLTGAAWALNVKRVDVPFFSNGSAATRTTAER